MVERPRPDIDRVREALRDRDERPPEDETPPPTEEPEEQEDDGDA